MVWSDFFFFDYHYEKFLIFMIFCSFTVGAYIVLIFALAFPIPFVMDPFRRGGN